MSVQVFAGRRRHLVRSGLVAGALLASAAVASSASAATIAVNAACYPVHSKSGAPIAIGGNGFTPGDQIVFSSSGNLDLNATATADGNGSFSVAGTVAPLIDKVGAAELTPVTGTITATDYADTGTVAASTAVTSTFFGVAFVSHKKAPGLRAFRLKGEWTFSGFDPGREIYGHYLFHRKQVALAKFGRSTGPCGYLQVRKAGYPTTPHHRSYPVQFDNARKYSKHASPSILTRLTLHMFF